MLGVTPDELIICGNSSLNIMYDTIAKFMLFGTGDGEKPNLGRIQKSSGSALFLDMTDIFL